VQYSLPILLTKFSYFFQELLRTCLEASAWRSAVLRPDRINAEQMCGLVLHPNASVRTSALLFFQSLIQVRLRPSWNLVFPVTGVFDFQLSVETCSSVHEPYADTALSQWMSPSALRTLVSNLCALVGPVKPLLFVPFPSVCLLG